MISTAVHCTNLILYLKYGGLQKSRHDRPQIGTNTPGYQIMERIELLRSPRFLSMEALFEEFTDLILGVGSVH